jgi:hypothetical protein
VAIPVETPYGPIPVPLPYAGNPPPIPSPAPILQKIHGGIAAGWSDVWGATKDLYDTATSDAKSVVNVGINDVLAIGSAAISVSQTVWSSYISALEGWVVTGIDELGQAVTDEIVRARTDAITLGGMIEALGGYVYDSLTPLLAATAASLWGAIDQLEHTLLGDVAGVESWAIDNIYHPLLNDITGVEQHLIDYVGAVTGLIEDWVKSQLNVETLERIAAIAGLAAALAEITTWVEECGAPMCEQFGPNTDLSKLLKLPKLLEILGLLAGLAALSDPIVVERATAAFVDAFGPGLESLTTNWLAPLEAASRAGTL